MEKTSCVFNDAICKAYVKAQMKQSPKEDHAS